MKLISFKKRINILLLLLAMSIVAKSNRKINSPLSYQNKSDKIKINIKPDINEDSSIYFNIVVTSHTTINNVVVRRNNSNWENCIRNDNGEPGENYNPTTEEYSQIWHINLKISQGNNVFTFKAIDDYNDSSSIICKNYTYEDISPDAAGGTKPNTLNAINELNSKHFELADHYASEAISNTSLDSIKDLAELYWIRGTARFFLSKWKEANADMRKAKSLNPFFIEQFNEFLEFVPKYINNDWGKRHSEDPLLKQHIEEAIIIFKKE